MNSYFGVEGSKLGSTSQSGKAAVASLATYVEDVSAWEEKFDGTDWRRLFSTRTIDYHGEEVKMAQHVRWENLEPAMPEGIGSIPLEEVCELGTLAYVSNFEDYLLPVEDQVYTKAPRVMVYDDGWHRMCSGLLSKGVCEVLPVREVYHLRGQPLLNGMFGVSKEEFHGSWEVHRLIMNLVPVNKLCRNLAGDISTLPNWAGMTPYLLDDKEITLMSSEDIRCFFYLFSIPDTWKKFMGFGKLLPVDLVPPKWKGLDCVLVSRVLPMGFLNSVSIAQHVHRRVARMALHSPLGQLCADHEIRRDRPLPSGKVLYRVYLDNFDLLEKVDQGLAETIKGTSSVFTTLLRQQYSHLGLPRHPKKAVARQSQAEIQGAWVDGEKGRVSPKPAKVLKYAGLAIHLIQAGRATQKELQIVCGGLVYCCMFRRAMLGMLNAVWHFICSFEGEPPVVRKPLPPQVQFELIRFVCAMPLAQMNLRLTFEEDVTASDASEYGGGFCVSNGLTPMGCYASSCDIRGDVPETADHVQVLTVGLFDGIAALRVAADALGLPMSGHVSCEVSKEGTRVVEARFPDSLFVGNVEDISEDMVVGWSCQHSNVGVVLVWRGPPVPGSVRPQLREERGLEGCSKLSVSSRA